MNEAIKTRSDTRYPPSSDNRGLKSPFSFSHNLTCQVIENKPELVEKLGIKVRANRTPAKRNAGPKTASTRAAKKAVNEKAKSDCEVTPSPMGLVE